MVLLSENITQTIDDDLFSHNNTSFFIRALIMDFYLEFQFDNTYQNLSIQTMQARNENIFKLFDWSEKTVRNNICRMEEIDIIKTYKKGKKKYFFKLKDTKNLFNGNHKELTESYLELHVMIKALLNRYNLLKESDREHYLTLLRTTNLWMEARVKFKGNGSELSSNDKNGNGMQYSKTAKNFVKVGITGNLERDKFLWIINSVHTHTSKLMQLLKKIHT